MSEGYSFRDILDYDDGFTTDELAFFIPKATKMALIKGRQQVEGMTIALASLFQKDVISGYMSKTQEVIDSLDSDDVLTRGPVRTEPSHRSPEKKSNTQHEARIASSMKHLGTLTSFMQGHVPATAQSGQEVSSGQAAPQKSPQANRPPRGKGKSGGRKGRVTQSPRSGGRRGGGRSSFKGGGRSGGGRGRRR